MPEISPSLPAIGTALPALGGTLGAYFAMPDGSVRALIVCDSEHELECDAWGDYGQDVPGARGLDGMANTWAMADAGCEIAKTVLVLATGGHADWMIGSRAQMLALYECVPGLFDKAGWYATSSQYSRHLAWAQDFECGHSYDRLKGAPLRVRPLRCIQLQALQDFFTSSGEAGAAAQPATEA
jgi:hypothetical protein